MTGSLHLPGSKSISNRLLVMRSLAGSHVRFENLSDADDTRLLKHYLKQIDVCASSAIPMVIDAANAGTVLRFLTACLALKEGLWLITGSERMKVRPIQGLVTALHDLGVEIEYVEKKNFPPLRITGGDIAGGVVKVDASASSQFVTALMLIAPYLEKGLQIRLLNEPVSFSYILMTGKLMQECGAKVKVNKSEVRVEAGEYQMKPLLVEPDWSSASYWYEMVALSENANIFLNGFSGDSIQGDRVAVEVFRQLGVATYFEENGIRLQSHAKTTSLLTYDFSSCPDLVPAVLATCAGKGVRAKLAGVGHLKFKESDRIASLQTELGKFGIKITRNGDTVELIPAEVKMLTKNIIFETHNDHRMAMALAPLVLKLGPVKISEPEVVTKSYPLFWEDMEQLGVEMKVSHSQIKSIK